MFFHLNYSRLTSESCCCCLGDFNQFNIYIHYVSKYIRTQHNILLLYECYRFKLAKLTLMFISISGAQRKMEVCVFFVFKAVFNHPDYT